MDLKDAHDYLRLQMGQERGGWETPEELDSFLHRAQMWLYSKEFDEYSKTQELQDSLGVFSTKFTYTSSGAGIVNLPVVATVDPCYHHLLSIWVQYFDNASGRTRKRPIKMFSEDELPDRLDSQICEVSITNPIGIELKPGEFQLYPETAISGYGFYLKKPVPPVFVYTQVGRVITYDSAGSTQLEWNEGSMNMILLKALELAGVNLSDNGLVQYTNAKTKED